MLNQYFSIKKNSQIGQIIQTYVSFLLHIIFITFLKKIKVSCILSIIKKALTIKYINDVALHVFKNLRVGLCYIHCFIILCFQISTFSISAGIIESFILNMASILKFPALLFQQSTYMNLYRVSLKKVGKMSLFGSFYTFHLLFLCVPDFKKVFIFWYEKKIILRI